MIIQIQCLLVRLLCFLPGGMLNRCSLELLKITSVKANEFPCSDIKAAEIRQQEQQPVLGTPTPPWTSTSISVSTQFPGKHSLPGDVYLWIGKNKTSDGLWLVRCAGSAAVTRQQWRDTYSHLPSPVNTSDTKDKMARVAWSLSLKTVLVPYFKQLYQDTLGNIL